MRARPARPTRKPVACFGRDVLSNWKAHCASSSRAATRRLRCFTWSSNDAMNRARPAVAGKHPCAPSQQPHRQTLRPNAPSYESAAMRSPARTPAEGGQVHRLCNPACAGWPSAGAELRGDELIARRRLKPVEGLTGGQPESAAAPHGHLFQSSTIYASDLPPTSSAACLMKEVHYQNEMADSHSGTGTAVWGCAAKAPTKQQIHEKIHIVFVRHSHSRRSGGISRNARSRSVRQRARNDAAGA